ncbi:MAG: acylphosphatase [Saprospiraceae bacterium]|nr:MAG: acylphosphatase [Saprospiraceae bacterium]
MVKHYDIWIEGRVQGVWFRASARNKAKELGVRGWVRNLPDGRVYAEAEGEEEALQQFVDWCHRGPELAEVTGVVVREGPVQGFEDFEIRR